MRERPSATSSEPYSTPEPVRFTPAEARVLPLLATYLTLRGIADRLGVRRTTVKTHVVSIYKKLGVTNRTQAIDRAETGGFLPAATSAPARGAARRRPLNEQRRPSSAAGDC